MLLLTNKTIDKLKYDLVRDGLVDMDGLNFALEKAQKYSTNLSEELINENLISEKKLLNFIQEKLHIPYVELSDYTPDITCLKYVSYENAEKYRIFPLFKIEDVLTIAMSDPLDLFAINNLFLKENVLIEPVVCAEKAVLDAIKKYYNNDDGASSAKNWTQRLINENLNDEIINYTITDMIKNAIDDDCEAIYFERKEEGMNIYFDKKHTGFIPNILATRFVYNLRNVFAHTAFVDENAPQNTKFDFKYKNNTYCILLSFLPTKYGTRISLLINPPLAQLENEIISKLDLLLEAPALIGLSCDIKDNFVYSFAQYAALKKSVLMIENLVKYELDNVIQVETGKNTGIYFDEIIKQIELQNFDVVFFEKIYTQEQFEKLKMFSKEKSIFVTAFGDNIGKFDYFIDKNGKIS